MPIRTYEKDCSKVATAGDLEDIVIDKRTTWRANPSKARRRQRRYKNRLTREFLKNF